MMATTLVIVESPAKSKTIGKYLGPTYTVIASSGHVRDLPESKLGVDVNNGYLPTYELKPGKEKYIAEISELAKRADNILLATDPDREGEAIAWHIAKFLKLDPNSMLRITFNEITESAIRDAVSHPTAINMDRFYAQQARRILDRLVGFELSGVVNKKILRGVTAGRVQSVATRLIVDRELEIQAFCPIEYWFLEAYFQCDSPAGYFTARYLGKLIDSKVQQVKLSDEIQVKEILQEVVGRPFAISQVKKTTRTKKPSAPFTTSTLQQDASRYLGFSSKRTMSVAQDLYEGIELKDQGAIALISYLRTDSVRVSDEASQLARDYIERQFGTPFLPSEPPAYKNKSKTQDAHEAIRPIHFDLTPQQLEHQLSKDQYRLYKLIWDRFIASQMSSAQIDTQTIDILAGNHLFRTSGENIRFPGYLAQYDATPEESDPNSDSDLEKPEKLPELTVNTTLVLKDLKPEQKFTRPPARFTEASLIKVMEEQGIGRPSTYAPTLSTLMNREYVEKIGKYLVPTPVGRTLTEFLKQHFPDIVDVTFTARMEQDLDTIEFEQRKWVELLDDFYKQFHPAIIIAMDPKTPAAPVKTGEKCPQCNVGEMILKASRYGRFIGCTAYPDCTYTRRIESVVEGHCPMCGSGLVERKGKSKTTKKPYTYYSCDQKGDDPKCSFRSFDLPIDGEFCSVCGTYMVLKKYRGRTFTKCGNKDCETNQKTEKVDMGEHFHV